MTIETQKLTCITVDDEPPALSLVSTFVEQTPFLSLAGKFDSAVKALQFLEKENIDLVFLDIEMPNLNGIELAGLLNRQELTTRVVFTTAYNQFATQSYQVDALDYLLKPYGYSDFLKTAVKAKTHFQQRQKINLPPPTNQTFMFVKSDYRLVRVDFDAILYLESINGYVKIHMESPLPAIMSITSLRVIEDKLPSHQFIRLHRSFIVAVNKINAVGKNGVQIEQHEIPIGDLYKESFHESLSKWS